MSKFKIIFVVAFITLLFVGVLTLAVAGLYVELTKNPNSDSAAGSSVDENVSQGIRYAFASGKPYTYEFDFRIRVQEVDVTIKGTKLITVADRRNTKIPDRYRKPGYLELDYQVTSRQLINGQEVDQATRKQVSSTMVMRPDGRVVFDLSNQRDFIPLLSNTPGELFMEYLGDGVAPVWDDSRVISVDDLGPRGIDTARFRLTTSSNVIGEGERGVRIGKNIALDNLPSDKAYALKLKMTGVVFFERERQVVTSIRMKGWAVGSGLDTPIEFNCLLVQPARR